MQITRLDVAPEGHEQPRPRWLADGGALHAWVRPDDRCFIDVEGPPLVAAALVEAVADELGRDLYTECDESDVDGLVGLGFATHRREGRYAFPVAATITGLPSGVIPAGYHLRSAREVEPAVLLALDNDLRQDVPGARGWRADLRWFREETYDSPAFDPATYLVAYHEDSGAPVGLVRIWWNPDGPRLGLVAVLPEHRRAGLARALLGTAFGVTHARGVTEVPGEIDDTHEPMLALARRIGARRIGSTVELVRRVELVRPTPA